jgi:hypothetical protein
MTGGKKRWTERLWSVAGTLGRWPATAFYPAFGDLRSLAQLFLEAEHEGLAALH